MIKKGEQRPTDRADDRCQAERTADAFVETLRMAAQCPSQPTKNGLRTPRFIPPAYIDPHRRPRTNSARRSIPAAA
ncbi:hypothetical protein [Actinocrispum sp. NPDC049592]|uniref:hypothetical protein n=1 Tax=Actinocrispum sp. NPDC049592 TaxID=3154835 RepID=UPI003442C883